MSQATGEKSEPSSIKQGRGERKKLEADILTLVFWTQFLMRMK